MFTGTSWTFPGTELLDFGIRVNVAGASLLAGTTGMGFPEKPGVEEEEEEEVWLIRDTSGGRFNLNVGTSWDSFILHEGTVTLSMFSIIGASGTPVGLIRENSGSRFTVYVGTVPLLVFPITCAVG